MVKLQSCWSNTHMSVYAPIKAFSVKLNLCLHVYSCQTNVWQRGPSYSFICRWGKDPRGAAQERHEHRLTVDSDSSSVSVNPRPASNSPINNHISTKTRQRLPWDMSAALFSSCQIPGCQTMRKFPSSCLMRLQSSGFGLHFRFEGWTSVIHLLPRRRGLFLTYVVVANKIAVIFVIQVIIIQTFFSLNYVFSIFKG